MPTLFFAKDHILRFMLWDYDRETKTGKHVLLPVRSYEKLVPHAFLRSLHNEIEFEDGLTVRDLFLNLEPWAELMEPLCQMDFAAFCEECRAAPTPNEELDYVRIFPTAMIQAVPEYESLSDRADILEWLRNNKPVVTDRLDLEIAWQATVVLKEPRYDPVADWTDYEVSCDYSPLSVWGHCPVRVESVMTVEDGSRWGKKSGHLSSSEPLFNQENPLVKELEYKGEVRALELRVEVPVTFMSALMKGAFQEWGRHYTPAGRDQAKKEIQAALDEAMAEFEGMDDAAENEASEEADGPTRKERSRSSVYDEEIAFRKALIRRVVEMDQDVRYL